jgi:hypothetical protein
MCLTKKILIRGLVSPRDHTSSRLLTEREEVFARGGAIGRGC